MMERKNGMRLPAVVLLAALAFSCFAPAALATAEEPPEDLPAAVSAQDGAQEETTLPGADAAQQDSAAGTGAANPHETIATSVQENPRFAKPQLDIPCRNAILISIDTGDILYEKEPDAEVPMASITKIMTLLLTLEAVEAGKISMTDIVPISEHAFNMGGSQIWLKENEQMTVSDMLKAVCVVSANDCAVALAETVAGSEEAFVERMNQRAAELGMADTHFCNATGLPAEGHVTSAYDIALMSRELIRNHPDIRQYTTIWMDSLRDGASSLVNTNRLIRFYQGATGLKTGSTDSALYCLSGTAERDGMELIAVIMKAPTSTQRFEDATNLLNYGFSTYTLENVVPESALPPVPVSLGTQATVQPVLGENTHLLLEKTKAGSLQQLVTLADSVEAPVAAGSQLGTLTITSGEEVVAELPILAGEEIPRVTFGQMLVQMLRTAFLCG